MKLGERVEEQKNKELNKHIVEVMNLLYGRKARTFEPCELAYYRMLDTFGAVSHKLINLI